MNADLMITIALCLYVLIGSLAMAALAAKSIRDDQAKEVDAKRPAAVDDVLDADAEGAACNGRGVTSGSASPGALRFRDDGFHGLTPGQQLVSSAAVRRQAAAGAAVWVAAGTGAGAASAQPVRTTNPSGPYRNSTFAIAAAPASPTSATGSRHSPMLSMPASRVTRSAVARSAYLIVAWLRDNRGCALIGPLPRSHSPACEVRSLNFSATRASPYAFSAVLI